MALLLQLTQKLAHGFDAFWMRWPRKVAKVEATKAWKQVVTPEDEPLIHAALDWQVPVFEQRDPERVPHAATWLRGRRWEDEPPAKAKVPQAQLTRHAQLGIAPRPEPSPEWLARMAQMREEEGQ